MQTLIKKQVRVAISVSGHIDNKTGILPDTKKDIL